MALFKQAAQPAKPPMTLAERQRRHQMLAETFLARAAKAGRLEAETRLATLGTGHAVMALLNYQQLKDGASSPDVVPDADEDTAAL